MKKIFTSLLFPLLLGVISSCDDSLDIVPKGQTTLNNLKDIELLLNQNIRLEEDPSAWMGLLIDECYPAGNQVTAMLSNPNSTSYAYLTYDENVDRISLTTNDERFREIYRNINFMNVVIDRVNDIDPESQTGKRLIAESRVMRAYLHFLCVNIYAAQYDESTADNLGGICYVDEIDITKVKNKLTLAESYNRILEDCSDEVIKNLIGCTTDVCRIDPGTAFAIRARVLFQMKRYPEAAVYAKKAIEQNNHMEDRSVIKQTRVWKLDQNDPSYFLYIQGRMSCFPTMVPASHSTISKFEEGDYTMKYCSSGWTLGYGESYCGVPGTIGLSSWSTYGTAYGLRVETMYYILAECEIRAGNYATGLDYVDQVRAKRVEDYEPFATRPNLDEASAMALLQDAKTIEFFASCENFFDRKRWNTEPAYTKTIVRDLGDLGTYTLRPDSKLYICPFPSNSTRYCPSLSQNI